jgi:hypothetical protein
MNDLKLPETGGFSDLYPKMPAMGKKKWKKWME